MQNNSEQLGDPTTFAADVDDLNAPVESESTALVSHPEPGDSQQQGSKTLNNSTSSTSISTNNRVNNNQSASMSQSNERISNPSNDQVISSGNDRRISKAPKQLADISILENPKPRFKEMDAVRNPSRLGWIYIFALLCSVDLMVNLPTLYDATISIQDKEFYIWIFGMYVLCQLIGSGVATFWMYHHSITNILLVSSILLLLGNILYTDGVAHDRVPILLLIGRGICGLAGSILIVGYAHVTSVSEPQDRETRIVFFSFLSAIGSAIGPLFGLIVANGERKVGVWKISAINAGSFALVIITMVFIVLYLIWLCFDEIISRIKGTNSVKRVGAAAQRETERMMQPDEQMQRLALENDLLCSRYGLLLLFLYIGPVFVFWALLTAIIPVGKLHNPSKLYTVYMIIGLIYTGTFLLNIKIHALYPVTKEKRIISAMLGMAIGCTLLTSLGLHKSSILPISQLIIGGSFVAAGFCLITIYIPAVYCKMSGANIDNIGLRMSWFFGVASLGRFFGPIYGYYIIEISGNTDFLAHSVTLLLLFLSFVAFAGITKVDSSIYQSDPENDNISDEDNDIELNTL